MVWMPLNYYQPQKYSCFVNLMGLASKIFDFRRKGCLDNLLVVAGVFPPARIFVCLEDPAATVLTGTDA
jgi:hypothetical protein